MAETVPGKSTWEMAKQRRAVRRKLGLLGLVALVEIVLFYLWLPIALTFPLALIGLWAVDHYFIGWMDFAFKRERDAARGAKGEEAVGAILNSLSTDCIVLHDVATAFGNVDHVVFRKDGAIFMLETKSHGGQVSEQRGELHLNGKPVDFLKQAHRNVFWLRDLVKVRIGIEPWISAAIVFPNAYVSVRRPLHGVEIVSAKFLPRWMAKVPGNPPIATSLWAQIEKLKGELLNKSLQVTPLDRR